MILNLLLSFGLFMGSSIPQGASAADTPSGFSIEFNGKYKVDYSIMTSYFKKGNYEMYQYGIGIGKEIILWNHLSIFPELGLMRGERSRNKASESGIFPIFWTHFLYLFPSRNPRFQIGFSLKEIFDEEIGTDFLDIGIGFRL